MMIFEGDRDFSLPVDSLFTKLADASFLVQCIPDSSVTGKADKKHAVCTVRPGFAFIRGSLEVTLEVAEAIEPHSIRLLLASKGIGSSSDVETLLTFAPQAAGTRIHWKAEVKRLGGLLKAVPGGLIRGAAQKVIQDVWTGVEKKLQEK
jgi:carbon monoxide dehydrogenase subunit G